MTIATPASILSHNRYAWDKKVADQDRWTLAVSSEAVARARLGQFEILLTPTKPVPASWFPPLKGTLTLCLASGGGQQAPLLAAAGANVTVFDNSPGQLAQDEFVAQREGLSIRTLQGDMADLSIFPDESFSLIVHPVSNCFVPHILPVWRECFRVLRPGGLLLAGFNNPLRYLFDDERALNGSLQVRHRIPYSDLTSLGESERSRLVLDKCLPLEFGHALSDQIDGQMAAGFRLTSMYEDRHLDSAHDPISQYIDTFIATRATKPGADD